MEKLERAAARAGRRAEEGLSALEGSVLFRGIVFFVLLAMMSGLTYLLNVHTPLILDDFDFMISWATGKPLAGFTDVIRSQMVHYQIWGGRLLHVFTQSFLYLGKDVFNAVNTAAFMLLLLEVYAIARPKRRFCWTLLLVQYLALMTLLPFFGTVFLWLTGSCIYLFGTVLALLPLVIVRSVKEGGLFSRGWLTGALCFPIGVLAGWTNENTTCGMIAVVFVMLALDLAHRRRVPRRLFVLWAGQCIGAMLLLLAPGNLSRASAYTYDSMIAELARRFVMVTAYLLSYVGLLGAGVVLVHAAMRDKAERGAYAWLLVFASVVSAYAMVGSPELSDRTFTGPFVLMLAALMTLLADAEERVRRMDAAKVIALPLVLVFAIYTGYHALNDVKAYEGQWAACTEAIVCAKEAGEESVRIPSVVSSSRFTMDIALNEKADQWPNTSISRVYGIDVEGL